MEGLAHGFGGEGDKEEDDDDDGIESSSKKISSLAEALKAKSEAKEVKETEQPTRERFNEDDDTAPELDAIVEAPLGHLSKVEAAAIAQTMASDRLIEIQQADEEVTSESLAAESFLENVEAGGDIDTAYRETMSELGETALASEAAEAEIAEPVDPESLVQAAKSELAPDISYRIRSSQVPAEQIHKPRLFNEASGNKQPDKAQSPRPEKAHHGIVDYVVGRRFGRLKNEHNRGDLENQLESEVDDLQGKLVSRESHVREVAQNRNFEKKPAKASAKELKPNKVENIGKVLIDSKIPAHVEAAKSERAAISAHTMSRNELLNLAEGIKVENSNLRQIYETHLVGEKGLRRVLAEYMRGGNFRKILRREIVEKEKDFERDPMLRDQASSQSLVSTHNELEGLLKRSGIEWSEPQPALAGKDKVKGANLPAFLEDIKSPSNPIRRVADVVLLAVIVGMAIVISILLLTR